MIQKDDDSPEIEIRLNASIFVNDRHLGNLYFESEPEREVLQLLIADDTALNPEELEVLQQLYYLAEKKMAQMQEELAKIYKERPSKQP